MTLYSFIKKSYLLAVVFLTSAVCADPLTDTLTLPPVPIPEASEGFRINNAILARVNGNAISVLDVIKKMDLAFHRSYPQLIDSKEARLQFYQSGWKTILSDMIHMELILADAVAKELKMTDGEVREEIENRFGPNIMSTLDRVGLTFDEAWKMIKNEMIVQRMKWYFVNSKALQTVTPKLVRQKYEEFCKENPGKETWQYQVLSLRSDEKDKIEEAAQQISQFLNEKSPDSSQPFLGVEAITSSFPECIAQVSSEYTIENHNISDAHRQILQNISINTFSQPLSQTSRGDKKNLTRIFYLKNHLVDKTPSFEEVAAKLQDDLLNQVAFEENQNYLEKLKKLYGHGQDFLEKIPDDFSPFTVIR